MLVRLGACRGAVNACGWTGYVNKHGSLAGGIPQVKGSNGPWGWPVVRQEEKNTSRRGLRGLGSPHAGRFRALGPWLWVEVGGAQQQLHPRHVGGPRSHTAIACFDEGRTGCCITRRTAPLLCRHRLPAATAASSGRRRRRCRRCRCHCEWALTACVPTII